MKQEQTNLVSKVKRFIKNHNQQRDLFNKAFLQPFEIALKTSKTQQKKIFEISKDSKPSNKKEQTVIIRDQLAIGLKLVVKDDISQNKYTLADFQSFADFNHKEDYIQIKNNKLTNLFSLLKPSQKISQPDMGSSKAIKNQNKVKLAICICTYVEDKSAYRKTIRAVLNNINKFKQQGLSPDQILVVIVQDGIEKVHESVHDFFSELEKQEHMYLDNQIEHLPLNKLINRDFANLEKGEAININELIFDKQELANRRKKRFQSRKQEYLNMSRNIAKIKQLQKLKKVSTNEFNPYLLGKLQIIAKKQLLQNEKLKNDFLNQFKFNQRTDQQKVMQRINNSSQEEITSFFYSHKKQYQTLINKTLRQAKIQCQKYIQSRNDLALVNCFRVNRAQFGAQNMKDDDIKEQESQQDFSMSNNNKQDNDDKRKYKMNLIFITKYKNSGKLSSHNWFLNGICKQIKCQYAILLDVGLIPGNQSLYKMITHMERDPKCGGVCGYMSLNLEKNEKEDDQYREKIDCVSDFFHNYFADIQKVQQVEYHFAHLIDKSFESLFKFIHVLPGAYSAYRMQALMPDKNNLNRQVDPTPEQDRQFRQKFSMSCRDIQLDADDRLMKQYFKSIQEDYLNRMKFVEHPDVSMVSVILKIILPDFMYYWCFKRPDEITEQQVNKIKATKELLRLIKNKQMKTVQKSSSSHHVIKSDEKQNMTYEQLLYNKNVYFAQDRTLCLGIFQNEYTLEYIPDASAWVDPVKNLHGLLGQRKRWINGSFFAFEHVKTAMLYRTSGNIFLTLQILYLSLMNILSFTSPAFFFFTVHTTAYAFRDWFFDVLVDQNLSSPQFQKNQVYNAFVYAIDFIYIMLMFGLVLKSMHFTHRDDKFIPYLYMMSTIFGLFSIAVFVLFFKDLVQGLINTAICFTNSDQNDAFYCSVTFLTDDPVLKDRFLSNLPGGVYIYFIYRLLIVSVFFLYFIPVTSYCFLYCKIQFLIQIIFGVVSFIFYTPTYLNIMPTFALCRIDDISWGTKGLDSASTDDSEISRKWKNIKMFHVVKFVFWNVVVGIILIILSSNITLRINQIDLDTATPQQLKDKVQYQTQLKIQRYVRVFYTTLALVSVVFITMFLKIFFGLIYNIMFKCKQCCYSDQKPKTQNKKEQVWSYFDKMKPSMYRLLEKYIQAKLAKNNQSTYKSLQEQQLKNHRQFAPQSVCKSIIELMSSSRNLNLDKQQKPYKQPSNMLPKKLQPLQSHRPFDSPIKRESQSSFLQLNSQFSLGAFVSLVNIKPK